MRQHLTPEPEPFRSRFNELAYIKIERLARILAGDIKLLDTPEAWYLAHEQFEETLDQWLPLNPQHDKRPAL